MRRVFKDDALEREFWQRGFVVVDFFTKAEAQQVRQYYIDYNRDSGSKLGVRDNSYELSFFDRNRARKQTVYDYLNSTFKAKWDRYLDNYDALITNMFDKEKNKGEVPVHQNWTFVDEDKARSVSVWIPLQDVSHQNGTLEVVPGTHIDFNKYRSPSVPWIFENITTQIKEKYMLPLELKMGQAAIIDDSILHYSSENKTDDPRIAVQLILKPAEVPALHYYFKADKNELEVFEADKDFFFDIDVTKRPDNLKLTGTLPYKHAPITEEDLAKFIEKHAETVS